MKVSTEYIVRTFECDFYGHVNGAVYLQYLEWGRWNFLKQVGVSLVELSQQGFQVVISEIQLKYLSPAFPEEVLVIETELAKLRHTSGKFSQNIFERATKRHILSASVSFVFLKQGRISSIPTWVREKLSSMVLKG